jgi:RNA polymerase sigma-70 factor (ECF subfamily)
VTAGRPDFPRLYRSEFEYVWKTLRRLGVPSRDIEDLAHDIFVVVHRHLHQFDPTRPVRPWLFGIAVRVVTDHRRTFRNSRELLEPTSAGGDPVDGAPAQDQKVAEAEARALLVRALDVLDVDRRAVLVMHDLDEVPMSEIAAALDIPVNTAYSRLRLARADVMAAVRRHRERER